MRQALNTVATTIMHFSVMFFSSTEGANPTQRYRMVLEAARQADTAGLTRVWLPERHYVQYGALHPNPAVLAAGLARETRRIRLAAGSVVLALHDPLSVVEQWAVVDNLSHGRVDLGFANGWVPDDFVTRPDVYWHRKDRFLAAVAEVPHLWAGGTVSRVSGDGRRVQVRAFPTPVQQPAPGIWLAAARSLDTVEAAGRHGFNLLTTMVDMGADGMADAIRTYRHQWEAAGHPGRGTVTCMVHTFLGEDGPAVQARARADHLRYIERIAAESSALKGLNPGRQGAKRGLSPAVMAALHSQQVDKVWAQGVLIGSPEEAAATVAKLAALDVDEIACLVDFIDDPGLVVEHLPALWSLAQAQRPSRR